MGQPAAKALDRIEAIDTHIVLIPSIDGPNPVPLPNPFNGVLSENLSENVYIMGRAAATMDSIAYNIPPHIPDGGPFKVPPTNRATIITGSTTVMINGKPAARAGDTALTCNDPEPLPIGKVMAFGTVMIGD